jgi:hypothetical protein
VEVDDPTDALVKRLVAAKASLKTARLEVESAQRFARSKEDAWGGLSKVINETRNLTAVWDPFRYCLNPWLP